MELDAAIGEVLAESMGLNFIQERYPETLNMQRDSVALHGYRSAIISYVLAPQDDSALTTALLLPLTRTRIPSHTAREDENVRYDRFAALTDQLANLPFHARILARVDREHPAAVGAEQLSYVLEFLSLAERGVQTADTVLDRFWDSAYGPFASGLEELLSSLDESTVTLAESTNPRMAFILSANALGYDYRSGLQLTGVGSASVGEHTWRAALAAYLLAEAHDRSGPDAARTLLLHDLHEYLQGDRNAISRKYVHPKESAEEAFRGMSLSEAMTADAERFDEHPLHKDADVLELVCETRLKECLGTVSMKNWPLFHKNRIRTSLGQDVFRYLTEDVDLTRAYYGKGKAVDFDAPHGC